MTLALDELRMKLLEGIKLSMQGSYHRRGPSEASRPFLEDARRGLKGFLHDTPGCAEAWRLLSQAEECFLNYHEAIRCLEVAMSLRRTRSKSDLKRLAMLNEALGEWSAMPFSAAELQELGAYLVEHGIQEGSPRDSMSFTKQWLAENGIVDEEGALRALNKRGVYSDFQVLYNVVRG
jgi:hypothetical protein